MVDAASSQGASLTLPRGSDIHCSGVGHLFVLVLASWLSLLSNALAVKALYSSRQMDPELIPLSCSPSTHWLQMALELLTELITEGTRGIGVVGCRQWYVSASPENHNPAFSLLVACEACKRQPEKQSFVSLCFDSKKMESGFFWFMPGVSVMGLV